MGDTYQENRDRLLRAFGSKKGKRASQIGSGMRINSEIMSSHIKETAAGMYDIIVYFIWKHQNVIGHWTFFFFFI